MHLIPAPRYSVRPHTAPSPERMPQSEILIDGQPTGKTIDGAVLEAALAWHGFVLLLLTDDIPHEETLRFYLLDSALTIVDSASMGAMYSTGALSELDLSAPDSIRFRFFGGIVWTLTLLQKEAFALPFLSEPRGVRRPFAFSRRFRISGKPMPETSV